MTRLISIDSSSTKTGWAIFDNGEFVRSGLINLDTKECRKKYKNKTDERIRDMCKAVIELLQNNKPDIVVIEKLNVGKNMVSVRALCKVIGAVYCYSLLNDVFYFEIQPSEWRSRLGMQGRHKRDEYKQMSVEYVLNELGMNVSDDESDAICVGIGYIKMMLG